MAELVPFPFGSLVSRMFRELDREDAIFSLPRRKFFTGSDRLDFSVRPYGLRASSPLGPAAGPHTQMAQNIVLGWLGGSRIFELKTVQVLDELKIPRPCIDMRTVGYNAEWSQELLVEESLAEYVKAAMLVRMLLESGRIPISPGFTDTIYDMSVGYDLAGIRSEKVTRFFDGMRDASSLIDRFRDEIPSEHAALRDIDFDSTISRSVTLSTFHGCPPDEIERIALYVMRERGLHCVVKFNPTLLGPTEVDRLLHEVLGYRHIGVPLAAFERDTRWDQALAMSERLAVAATECGVGFGVKFSNTLIVENDAGFLPPSEKEVYLSGAPLHVLAIHLVERFRRHFGDRIPISFSAGINAANYPAAVALGLLPVTVCSDLLQAGGFGRLAGYHEKLREAMDAKGATSIDDFAIAAFGNGAQALGMVEPGEREAACLAALAARGSLREAAGEDLYSRWVSAARLLNTTTYVEAATADPRYSFARNAKLPPHIDSRLHLFDCITCDKCVPVCPNDANFTFAAGESRIPMLTLQGTPAAPLFEHGEDILLERPHQLATFADFCNRCGNCDVFCPEEGGPYEIKPLFFGSEKHFLDSHDRDGFFVSPEVVLARSNGSIYRLEIEGAAGRFSGAGFTVDFRLDDPEGTLRGHWSEPVPLTWAFIMDLLRRSVLDPARVNYVNLRLSDAPHGVSSPPARSLG